MFTKIINQLRTIMNAPPKRWQHVQTIEVDSFGFYQFAEFKRKLPSDYRIRLVKPRPEGSVSFCACDVYALERQVEAIKDDTAPTGWKWPA